MLLFADSGGILALLGFLGAHVALTLVQLLVAAVDPPTLDDPAVVIAMTGGFQVAVGAAGAALDRVAAAATEAARRQAATVTAEEVAPGCTDDREERVTPLRDSVLPLLRGVGDGSLSPADPRRQRRARARGGAAAAAVRGGERDARPARVVELGSLVDVVEQRGTEARFPRPGSDPCRRPWPAERWSTPSRPRCSGRPPIGAADVERCGKGVPSESSPMSQRSTQRPTR